MEWHCGFYLGSDPGEHRYGTAKTFNDARAAFEAAWRDYLPNRTETDFEEWREDAAWHAAKFARWDHRRRTTLDRVRAKEIISAKHNTTHLWISGKKQLSR
jgi:hypothetical protein